MNLSATGHLPDPVYLRLLEYQKRRGVYPAYAADLPLLFFISFSRIAAGLSILSVFFPASPLWPGIAFLCMVLATGASITHLTIPTRFLNMIINHRSPLVWEIRLAGTLTGLLGAQILFHMGILPGFLPETFMGVLQVLEPLLPWVLFLLSLLFLISTGSAYRFHTHPAWKTPVLPAYYLASASMIGVALYSTTSPNPFFRLVTVMILCSQGFLILLYLNHLSKTSWDALNRIVLGKDRSISQAFLVSVLIIPGLMTFAPLFTKNIEWFAAGLALSNGAGMVFERILFFRVEKPVFFLSRDQYPEPNFYQGVKEAG
jgi:DMSO reductase anchor subunit